MSKIIDILNRELSKKYNSEKFTQDELIKTFFDTAGGKRRRLKFRPRASWVIATLAVIIAGLIIVQGILKRREVFFVKEGLPNEILVEGMSYFGDVDRSEKRENTLVFVNTQGAGWANFNIRLKKPVDMRKRQISYSARGKFGDERLVVILVDAENRTYRIRRTPLKPVKDDWQYYYVNPIIAKGAIDISSIREIKFEFGGLTAGNYPSATIFLKDISIKEREV